MFQPVFRGLRALWGSVPPAVRAEAITRAIDILLPVLAVYAGVVKAYPFWIQVNLFVASIIISRAVTLICGYVYTRFQMRPAFAVVLHSGARDGLQIGRAADIAGADYIAQLEVTAPHDVDECSATVTAVRSAWRGAGEHRLTELVSEHLVRLRWDDGTLTANLTADAPRLVDLAIVGEDEPNDYHSAYFVLARPGAEGHRYPSGVYCLDVVLSGRGIRKRSMHVALALVRRRSALAHPVINLKWWDEVGVAWLANDDQG